MALSHQTSGGRGGHQTLREFGLDYYRRLARRRGIRDRQRLAAQAVAELGPHASLDAIIARTDELTKAFYTRHASPRKDA